MTDACAGRVGLVTGASRGIGAAIARRLAAEGAAVACVARTLEAGGRLPGSLRETAEAIESDGGRAAAIVADLAVPEERQRVVPEAEAALGAVDILVNNAAAAFYLPVAEFPARRRRVLFEVNFEAAVELVQAVLPGMRERRRGWILNISSAASKHPDGPPYDEATRLGSTTTMYGAAKAALERFTTGLAAEVHADGVAVNSLAPVAAVRTPGADAHVGALLDERPELVEPMEVMVEAALALCTGDPDTMTGRICYSRPLLDELGLDPRSPDGLGAGGG